MTFGLEVEIRRQHRLTNIQTDQHHFLTQHRQGQSRVTRHVRLTVAVDARGNQNNRVLGFLGQHEPQVGTNQTEQLGRNSRLAFMNRNMRITAVLYQLSQQRRVHTTLELFRIIDLIVEQDIQVQHSGREKDSEQETEHQQLLELRTLAAHIALRHIQNLRRHRRSSQHQRVLFPFLVQVDIESLLDLLLTHDADVLPLLLRRVLNLLVELRVLFLQAVFTDQQALAYRTDRRNDVTAHGSQLIVHLLNDRVHLRRRTLNTHALQLQRVVLRQSARQRSVRHTQIRRNQVLALALVAQELIDILDQAQLGLYLCQRPLLHAAGL